MSELLSAITHTTLFVGSVELHSGIMSTHGANTLVSLPRPLGSLEGQYHAATVWGWRNGSRNRKRSEIVVGIDGEGVNIYNVCPYLHLTLVFP